MRLLPSLRHSPTISLGRRMFSDSYVLRKDEKSKQLLEKLGMNLQKGNLKSEDSGEQGDHNTQQSLSETDNKEPNEASQSERQQMLNRVQDCYNSISHMTVNDLMIQKNLDQGTQFSFPSEHYINRKEIINSLPDDIDIFNTPMSDIESTYEKLSKLDNDRSVHLKYYKRYLQNYNDPINNLIQEFNGITEKFKLLRRREMDSLTLAPGAYLYKENLFGNPYNVIGFDRSVSGLPLRSGKHKVDDKCYPQEFIEDLQMYRTKIPVHKRDLDFVEYEENSVNVDPERIQRSQKVKNESSPLDSVYKELGLPKNSVVVKSLDEYKMLIFKGDLVVRIENEILFMKRSLQHEIEMHMNSSGNRLLLFNHQDLKHSQFRLCETHAPEHTNSALIIINYNLKHFNLIPNYAFVMNTRIQKRRLEKHLFKIFLLNLEDQIDTLFRIKYYDERKMTKFMRALTRNIQKTISFKLMKFFTPFRDGDYKSFDALAYKPQPSVAFKRLYWLHNSTRRDAKYAQRSSIRLKMANLAELSEK